MVSFGEDSQELLPTSKWRSDNCVLNQKPRNKVHTLFLSISHPFILLLIPNGNWRAHCRPRSNWHDVRWTTRGVWCICYAGLWQILEHWSYWVWDSFTCARGTIRQVTSGACCTSYLALSILLTPMPQHHCQPLSRSQCYGSQQKQSYHGTNFHRRGWRGRGRACGNGNRLMCNICGKHGHVVTIFSHKFEEKFVPSLISSPCCNHCWSTDSSSVNTICSGQTEACIICYDQTKAHRMYALSVCCCYANSFKI